MNNLNLEDILALIEKTAREAGAYLYEGFSKQKTIDTKSSAIDLVTEYDQGAEDLIVSQLTAVYPTFNILAEEGSSRQNGSPYTWIIDPLDGTNNYANGLPHFSVSIALYEGNKPLIGVVYDPGRNECFTAVSGQGAFLQNGSHKTQLHVSEADSLVHSMLGTGFPYDRHTDPQNNILQLEAFLKTAQGIRRSGSAALDVVYVAAGRLAGYWEFKVSPWDIAAGQLILLEAGGQTSDVTGQPIQMIPKIPFVASNGRIHQQLLNILASV